MTGRLNVDEVHAAWQQKLDGIENRALADFMKQARLQPQSNEELTRLAYLLLELQTVQDVNILRELLALEKISEQSIEEYISKPLYAEMLEAVIGYNKKNSKPTNIDESSDNTVCVAPASQINVNGDTISQTFITATKRTSKSEPTLIHFDQSDMIATVLQNKDVYKDLNHIVIRYGGLCELISNYVLLNDLMGSRELKAGNYDNRVFGQMSVDVNNESISLKNPYEKINIADIELMPDTHTLKCASVMQKMLAFIFNKYPNSALSYADQKKLMKNMTVNHDILEKSLKTLAVGDYLKQFSYSKSGLKFEGHSCLIKKTGPDMYSYFDPNGGEFSNLDLPQLAQKIDEMNWRNGYQGIVLQRASDVKQKLANKVRKSKSDAPINNNEEQQQPANNNTMQQDLKIILGTDSAHDFLVKEVFKLGSITKPYRMKDLLKQCDQTGLNNHEKFIMEVLMCDDVNHLDKNQLVAAIDYLSKLHQDNKDYKGAPSLINSLQLIIDYMSLRQKISDPAISQTDAEEAKMEFLKLFHAARVNNTIFLMQGANLSGLDFTQGFSKDSLGEHSISGNFSKADLSNSNLAGTKIMGNLADADLSHTDLSECFFFGANLTRTNLQRANLANSIIRNSSADYSNLQYADCRKMKFDSDTRLEFVNLDHADLREADININSTALTGTSFDEADLRGINIRNRAPKIDDQVDLLPEKWRDQEVMRSYLNNVATTSAVGRGKMTIAINIIRNLNASELTNEQKISYLNFVKNQDWLKAPMRMRKRSIFAADSSKEKACKAILQDEISRLNLLAKQTTMRKS